MLPLLEDLFTWKHTFEVGHAFIYLGDITDKATGFTYSRLRCYPLERRIILQDSTGIPDMIYHYKLQLMLA